MSYCPGCATLQRQPTEAQEALERCKRALASIARYEGDDNRFAARTAALALYTLPAPQEPRP